VGEILEDQYNTVSTHSTFNDNSENKIDIDPDKSTQCDPVCLLGGSSLDQQDGHRRRAEAPAAGGHMAPENADGDARPFAF